MSRVFDTGTKTLNGNQLKPGRSIRK